MAGFGHDLRSFAVDSGSQSQRAVQFRSRRSLPDMADVLVPVHIPVHKLPNRRRLCDRVEFAGFPKIGSRRWRISADPGTIHGRVQTRRNDLRAGRVETTRAHRLPDPHGCGSEAAGSLRSKERRGPMRRDWRNVLLPLTLFLAGATLRLRVKIRRSMMQRWLRGMSFA